MYSDDVDEGGRAGKKAKFIKGLNTKERTTLTLAVSMENEKQTGEDLEAFIVLVNQHKNRVKRLKIVLSCYLQRHYIGKQAAEALFDKWKGENKDALSKLDPDIELEVVGWRTIIETDEFKCALQFLTRLYDESEEFRTKVKLLSNRHSHKADAESSKSYLLEENTFFMIYKGIVCYPGQHLNAANEFVVQNYNKDLIFCGYIVFIKNKNKLSSVPNKNLISIALNFFPASPITRPQNEVIQEGGERVISIDGDYLLAYASTAKLMVQFGICDRTEQEACFNEIIEVIKNYSAKTGVRTEDAEKLRKK